MKLITFGIIVLFSFKLLVAQDISGSMLLEKAIQYHDPTNQWHTFKGEFDVLMEMPDSSKRISHITINLPEEYFKVSATKGAVVTAYEIDKDKCLILLNGSDKITKEDLEVHNLSCDRATMYKDYYTYLYGLPMKLKDEGTNISETIERKIFKGKTYLVLKVTYDEAIGSDVWYFYFHPETFAMEIYQFFKTDEKGNLKPDSGEYIMLSETETINQIKIPKIRAWYYNKDDAYLATDILKQ